MESSRPEDLIGESCGNYRLVELIGQGGMGFVYRAEHHAVSDLNVAVKVLRPELSTHRDLVYRFFNEARASASLSQSAVVKIFDCGFLGAHAYLVMELLRGEPLSGLIARRGRLEPEVLTWLAAETARALAAVHEAQIVHRDLKPDNVFLTADPATRTAGSVRLLDFGIAKLHQHEAAASLHTRPGSLLGTPLYMSPEQCAGGTAAPVDHRTDIYALGCMMFEMACGRPPFTPAGEGAIIAAHVYATPPSPRSLAPELPAALDALVLAMLQKDPERRPSSMRAVVAALAPSSPSQGHGTRVLDDTDEGLVSPSRARTLPARPASARTTFTRSALETVGRRGQRRAGRTRWALGLAALGVSAAVAWVGLRRQPEPSLEPIAGPVPVVTAAAGAPPPPVATNEQPAPAAPSPAPAPIAPVAVLSAPPGPSPAERAASPPGKPRERARTPPTHASPQRSAEAETPSQLRLESLPAGARVCVADSGRLLGTTPFTLDVRALGGATLVVEKDGHRSVELATAPQGIVRLRRLAADDLEDPRICKP